MLAALLLMYPPDTASAQASFDLIADDFEKDSLDLKIWNPRQIRSERYHVDRSLSRSGRSALAILVGPADTGCNGACQRNV